MSRALLLLLSLAGLLGCDRNVQPFVPGEEPRQPDLSKIFPAGAEQALREQDPVQLPPAPGLRRGGPDPSAQAEPIRGVITLAEELAGRVPEQAVLYLMVRAGAAGPPLAVQRIPSPEFPLRFAIGPDDRMGSGVPFEGLLHLSARLDGDGEAISRQPGDIQGHAPQAHPPGASGVQIVLDELL